MGNVFEQVCCISNEDLLKNEKYDGDDEENYRSTLSQYRFPSNSLPFSQINFSSSELQKKERSSSNLPIGIPNLIRKQTGDPLMNYKVLKPLGHGTFGHVFKVIHKTTGNIRAMKVIPKNNLKPGFTEEEIEQEINILKKLDHPKIIKLYEFYSDNDYYYLINEFCSDGGLDEKLAEIRAFPECIVKVLMFQILSAVSYLHSRKVIHGDLKLENIMIDSVLQKNKSTFISSIQEDAKSINETLRKSSTVFSKVTTNTNKNDELDRGNSIKSTGSKLKYSNLKNYDLKLIDFGCSKIFTKYKNTFSDTIGTLIYCSPEVLKNNYNEKCDMWSIGIIMYVLLSGEFPFHGHTEKEISQKILNGKFVFDSSFDNVSDTAKDLITKCLIYDKNQRIPVKYALNHPFFMDDIDPHNIFSETLDSTEVLLTLKNFAKYSKFNQAVLAFLSHNYAEKNKLDKLKKIFLSIDLNLDGKISREELKYAYKSANIKISDEQLDKIIKAIDFDNNGFIEYEEFIRVTIPKEHLFTEVNLKTAFDLFDLDKNGKLSVNDIVEVLGMGNNIEESVTKELFSEIQSTGEPEITFDKFKCIIDSFAEELIKCESPRQTYKKTGHVDENFSLELKDVNKVSYSGN